MLRHLRRITTLAQTGTSTSLHTNELNSQLQKKGGDFKLSAFSQVLSSTVTRLQPFVIECESISKSCSIGDAEFHFKWLSERHTLRSDLGFDSYSATLQARDLKQDQLQLLFAVTADDKLVETSQLQTVADLIRSSTRSEVSTNELRWFVAFMCSHPSDWCFDVVSEALQDTH